MAALSQLESKYVLSSSQILRIKNISFIYPISFQFPLCASINDSYWLGEGVVVWMCLRFNSNSTDEQTQILQLSCYVSTYGPVAVQFQIIFSPGDGTLKLFILYCFMLCAELFLIHFVFSKPHTFAVRCVNNTKPGLNVGKAYGGLLKNVKLRGKLNALVQKTHYSRHCVC